MEHDFKKIIRSENIAEQLKKKTSLGIISTCRGNFSDNYLFLQIEGMNNTYTYAYNIIQKKYNNHA